MNPHDKFTRCWKSNARRGYSTAAIFLWFVKIVNGDCWGKYQYFNGRDGCPCSSKPIAIPGDEACGYTQCAVGYYCSSDLNLCVPCNNAVGEYPNFPGYYASSGLSYNGNDCLLTCPIGYTKQIDENSSYVVQDRVTLVWTRYTFLQGQCRKCQSDESCSYDLAKFICGGQDPNYFGWVGQVLFPNTDASSFNPVQGFLPIVDSFLDCRCPLGYINNMSADAVDCGSITMRDGQVLHFSCCQFVGYLAFVNQSGGSQSCFTPWPQCISSDIRGIWQYLKQCTFSSDRACIPCDNPNKPVNSHYVQSSLSFPGMYQCIWKCNDGYYESGWNCLPCTNCTYGQTISIPCNKSSNTFCQPCPNVLPAGSYYPLAGNCISSCTPDYYLEDNICKPCSTNCSAGYYRQDCSVAGSDSCVACSNRNCIPCTNKFNTTFVTYYSTDGHWVNVTTKSSYTSWGSWRSNNCPWTCDVGFYPNTYLGCTACTNKPSGLLPVQNWTCSRTGMENVCFPTFKNVSFYTSAGELNGNDCAWVCNSNYARVDDDCV